MNTSKDRPDQPESPYTAEERMKINRHLRRFFLTVNIVALIIEVLWLSYKGATPRHLIYAALTCIESALLSMLAYLILRLPRKATIIKN